MTITFNEELHEYRFNGKVVPSVTQLIEWAYNFSHVPEDVMEYKSMLGTAVHKACELLDLGTLDESSVDPVVAPYLDAYRRFTAECHPKWDAIEMRVFSEIYGYAGTLDRRGEVMGSYGYFDIKTSATISPPVGMQLSGYKIADGDRGITTKRAAIQLKPNGKYQVHWFTDAMDDAAFLSAVTLSNWRKKHET